MECTYVSHLTDNQLIDLNNMYLERVQSTMDQLMEENEIFQCFSESTYRMKRNEYITHVFLRASEMCNSWHTHNTVVWKVRVWKYKITDEEMMSQICQFCNKMIVTLQSFNPTTIHDDIRSLFSRSQELYQVVYKDKCMFTLPRHEKLNEPPACKRLKLEC